MRRHLRWKILLLTVPPLLTLVLATLWIVNRSITDQSHRTIREDLRRASAVFETLLASRSDALEVASAVIVRDPKFFSVLTLPGLSRDQQFRATVRGVALDFNASTRSDLFEVLDGEGRLVTSVGDAASSDKGRTPLVREALGGRAAAGLLAERDRLFQVVATPVFAGGRTIGVLLLGMSVGHDLAERLRALTRSEVTFVSGGVVTGTTLEAPEDREAVTLAISDLERRSGFARGHGELTDVRGAGQTYLTLASAIPPSGAGEHRTYVMQRALDAETAFLRGMQSGLVQLGLIAMLLTLLAGFVIAAGITAPLRRLVRAAEEMERDNYDYPLEVTGRDEIGYLAERFQEMRQRQRAYVTSLQEVARLKTEFLSVASHELRTPISVIKGYAELLADGSIGPVNGEQKLALEAVTRGVARLTRIAEDATRMAQIEGDRLTLEIAPNEISKLIERAVNTVRAAAPGRKVEVVTDVAPELGSANVDGERLELALTHLISNAIRFTQDGGRVEVRGRRLRNTLQLEVVDNGVGIAADKRRHIFERAVMVRGSQHHHSSNTLEFNSAGLGLGLSIARGIAEAHGGTIWVESEVGCGSQFVIELPLEATESLEKAA